MSRVFPLLVWAVTALAGCADPGLLLTIDEAGVADEIDALELQMVATRTKATGAAAETCRPVTRTVTGDRLSFPIDWAIGAGGGDWSCVAVRVIGTDAGTERIRREELYCPDPEAVTREHLVLHQDCLDDPCAEGEACVAQGESGGCEPSSVGAIFDQPPVADRSCDGAGASEAGDE